MAKQKSDAIPLFYVCEHGSSNSPCEKFCHFDVSKREQPPTMPDNWYKKYESPATGVTDSATITSEDG